MKKYSEQDLKYAAEFRDEIHKEALEIVRKTRPYVTEVIDRHPVEDYFQENWEYPGKWYTIVAVPYGYGSRKALVDAIVRNTLSGRAPKTDADNKQELKEMARQEQNRRKQAKQLDAEPEGYSELFKIEINRNKGRFRAVGIDDEGRYILEQYEEYSLKSSTGSRGSYYVLSDLEYARYARQALINGCLKEDDYFRLTAEPEKQRKRDENPFYQLLEEYPELVVDYFIVENESYSGYESHRKALKAAYDRICEEWNGNPGKASGKAVDAAKMFSSDYKRGELNYRKAFLYPPHRNSYSGKDFARVNAALFPNGTDKLEVYEWDTDWSDYFDDGHEWWGALCLTFYDKTLGRFVVIMASATD